VFGYLIGRYSALMIQGLSGSRTLLASVFLSLFSQPVSRWKSRRKPSCCKLSKPIGNAGF
ncbi:hypothetical protein, partial [Vibrio sp. S9_S30]|uniref:hypothetical protein n=1 Tax=Vibrio sp. S9_S30 TaxID=2720226 RepID=UPI001EEE806E